MNINGKNPYVGPRTFLREEGELFFGREREARDLLALVVSEQLVLFYAQSGAGKSSLVNTRLIPNLEKKGFEVLPVTRVSGETPPGVEVDNIYIFNLTRNLVQHETNPDSLSHLSLTEFLDKLSLDEVGYFYDKSPLPEMPEGEAYIPWRRALIIDQFEELFSTHPEAWGKREDFFRQLANAMQNDPYLWVVLVMREDYIAALDPFAYLMPGGLRVRYYMQRLGREAALKAVKSPVAEKRPFATNVAEKLVDDLCSIKMQKLDGTPDTQPGQYVEPVQLQVVCYSLWENLPAEGTQITEKDLQDVGDVNQSLGRYYAGRVKTVAETKGVKERLIREWFEKKLISPGGIRTMVLQEPNKRSGGLADHVIRALQSDLVRAETRGGGTFYELTHDRLVEPIIENNKMWFDENLSPLQRQAALWVAQEQNDSWLLNDQALAEVEQWAKDNQDELTDTEREFLEACRKQQAQLDERRESQRRELEMAQNLAKEQERLADEQRKSAEQARLFAEEQERFAKEQERYGREQAYAAKRARLLTRIAFSFLAFAIIFLGIAISRSITAENNAETAREKEALAITAQAEAMVAEEKANNLADTARARELASAAKSNLDSQLDLSILLSLEAYKLKNDNPEVRSALFSSMQRALRLRGYLTTSEDPAEEFRYSPNGQFMAVLKENGITLWNLNEDDLNVQGGDLIPNSDNLDEFNYDFQGDKFIFSPDDAQLIYLSREGLNFWDIASHKMLNEQPINGHKGSVDQIVFNGDRNTFATSGGNGEVTLWNIDDISSTKSPSYQSDAVAFSSDGKKFAVLDSQKGNIVVGNVDWQVKESLLSQQVPDSTIISIQQEPDTVTSIAFNQSGDLLAMGLKDGSITIWNLTTGSVQDTINTGQNTAIRFVSFNSIGTFLVYTGLDGTRILNLDIPTTDPSPPITSKKLSLSPNGDTLAFAIFNNKNQIELLDVADNNQIGNPIDGELIAFSPDSRSIAIFDKAKNTISLFDVSNNATLIGTPFQRKSEHPVSSMAFSQDGNFLAVGTINGELELWDIASQTLISSDASQTGSVTSLAFSPDGNTLIAGRGDDSFSVLGINSRKLRMITGRNQTNYLGRLTSFRFDPESAILYSMADDGVLLLDGVTAKGDVIPGSTVEFIGSKDEVSKLVVISETSEIILRDLADNSKKDETIQGIYDRLSPDERILVVRQESGIEPEKIVSFTLWDTFSGKQIGDSFNGNDMKFSPDSKTIALSRREGETSQDTYFSLWDALTGKAISESIRGTEVIFSFDDKSAAIYNSETKKFVLWDLAFRKQIGKNIDGFPTFAPKHKILAAAKEGNITLWNTSTGEPIETDNPIKGNMVIFSASGERFAIVASSPFDNVTLWNTASMKQISNTIPGSIIRFGIGPDESTMMISNGSGFTLWDITSGELLGGPLTRRENIVSSPKDKFLVFSDAYGGTIWDLETSIQIGTFSGSFRSFSPNHEMLFTGNNDNTISIWDVATATQIGGPVREQTGQQVNVKFDPPNAKFPNDQSGSDLVFSPDNNETMAVFNRDGSISLWGTSAPPSIPGTILNIQDFSGPLANAALSPDGNTLALSSQDQIKLYRNSGDNSFSVQAEFVSHHTKEVTGAAVSPDGKILISYHSGDSSLSLWDTSTRRQIGETIRDAAYNYRFSGDTDANIIISASPAYSYAYMYMYTLRDASTGKPIGEPLFGENIQFSPDGKYLVLYNSYNSTGYRIFETANGEQLGDFVPASFRGFASDSKSIITTDGTSINLWDFIENKPKAKRAFPAGLYDYRLSSNGTLYATTSRAGVFEIKNLETGAEVSEINLKDFQGSIGQFSPDGTVITLYDYSKSNFILYDITSPIAQRIGGEDNFIPGTDLIFSPDGKFAAASYYYRPGITLWDTTTALQIGGSITGRYQGFGNESKILIVSKDKDNLVDFWNTKDLTKARGSFEYDGAMNGVKLGLDDKTLSVYGNEGIVLLDLTDPRDVGKVIRDDSGTPQRMLFNPNSSILATVGTDGLSLWDISGQEPASMAQNLKGQVGRISDVRFTRDGNIVYLDSNGNVYKLAQSEIEKFKDESNLKTGLDGACPGSLSPYGTYVVKQAGKILQIWDALQNTKIKDLPISDASCPRSIAFSLEERSFAYSYGSSNRIFVFTANERGEAFAPRAELIGRSEDNPPYYDLGFMYGENILVSRSGNGRILLWDIENRTLVAASDQAGEPKLLADGRMLIYLRPENKLVLIDITQEELNQTLKNWTELLCGRVGHNLFPTELLQYFRDEADAHKQTCEKLPPAETVSTP